MIKLLKYPNFKTQNTFYQNFVELSAKFNYNHYHHNLLKVLNKLKIFLNKVISHAKKYKQQKSKKKENTNQKL